MVEDQIAKLLDRDIEACMASILSVEIGDSHRFALLKGTYNGLTRARQIVKDCLRVDMDDED